jgi:cardiolipin synthase
MGTRFRDALTARARAGVRVRVMYDSLGSAGTTPSFFRPLVDAGGEVFEYHALLQLEAPFRLAQITQRDHRKVLVVDGRIGFVGGLNIGDEWLPPDAPDLGYRDDAVEVRGDAVRELRTLFYGTWRRVTRQAIPADVTPIGRKRTRRVFTLSNQRRHRRSIHREYLLRIAAARASIDVANAYFIPELRMRRALYRAAARGVRIRVLLPHAPDVPGLQFAVEALWDRLLRRGIEIYVLAGPLMHAKTAIVDDRFVTVGSYNFDERSWRGNLEANVGIVDEAFARHVRTWFDRDVGRATRIDLDTWRRRSLARRGAEWVALAIRGIW